MFQCTNKLESGDTLRFESWVNLVFLKSTVLELFIYMPIFPLDIEIFNDTENIFIFLTPCTEPYT